MSLPLNERAKLDDALRRAFPDYRKLAGMVKNKLDWNLEEIASSTLELGAVRRQLIDEAETRDMVLDLVKAAFDAVPSKLLEALLGQLKGSAEKQRALLQYHPPNATDACLVHHRRPFINRRDFRRNLVLMSRDIGPRILFVNGATGLGKSHSLHLISYMVTRTENSRLGELNLDQTNEKRIDPGTLLRLLSVQLRLSPKDDLLKQAAQDAWWAYELASWLVSETTESEKNCWIVLDGFDHPAVPEATLDFIKYLLLLSHKSARLRLVLIDFREDRMPAELLPFIIVEQLTEINETELRQFVSDIFAQGGAPEEQEPARMAAKIWQTVSALRNKPEFTRKLAEALLEALNDKFAADGGI